MATEIPFGTVERHTLSSSAYASIKQAILSGALPPGTRLTEKYLTERLDVSRSTVREAIARLVHEGYLIGKPYEGYRVNHPTPEDVRDAYEVLIGLTQMVVKLALERADQQQHTDMLSLVDASAEALASGEIRAYSDAAWEFRLRAAEYSQNRHLSKLYEQYANHPASLRPYSIDDLESVRRRAIDFCALREAVKNRDGIRAGEVLADNLRKNLRKVLAELENSPNA